MFHVPLSLSLLDSVTIPTRLIRRSRVIRLGESESDSDLAAATAAAAAWAAGGRVRLLFLSVLFRLLRCGPLF